MSINSIFQSFPQLETKRLILRRMQVTDSDAIFRILGDDQVTQHYDDATFTDVSQAGDQIEAWEKGFVNKRCIRWGIARNTDRLRNSDFAMRGYWKSMKTGTAKVLPICVCSHC
ncbi:MAG: GNAT family N-acetyltransferase [Anaerolineae bacterium]|nr:GNAT family N-acetyltransferase [Anaerolineae bacterium]